MGRWRRQSGRSEQRGAVGSQPVCHVRRFAMRVRGRDGTTHEVDANYILADGESLVVDMMMMDSGRSMIRDASGQAAGSRPGFLLGDNDRDHAVPETVYREYAN